MSVERNLKVWLYNTGAVIEEVVIEHFIKKKKKKGKLGESQINENQRLIYSLQNRRKI